MQIDWNAFTPWASLAGGLLIGIAAAMFIWLNGRIAGVSGVLSGLLWPARGDVVWRVAFLGGLVAAPLLYHFAGQLPAIDIQAGDAALVASGLLVGIGTSLSGGCTSGHGVCGISRMSGRSIVATLAFMAAGFVTVLLSRHLLGI
ncbi:YeeE/YedE family protein [Caenimonas koreensis DSM 17982]|uniref:YeeE/YedE family protein n=1 Tax=Caenimonas koreensis DSM 17982 TaxID=1121255 RepID=A0A844AUH2_9BURK|nr:YeeE/YedE family protein [Caenimonas koreensis]MRD48015.1 YeeE/YedE family protein [Caenimonas koreensis DSM 17982]